ncbi:ankyrin repeat-containing domain protein [Plectosphaerella cucumerina]|uniref:Ankyrin repeat-containing domain protein n=1 Tax=Plectosphaerella cucumerina TaxID=40658 RepID=A0A8K0TSN8_9PEZI|nr:ankyrin repeat-containing domain protein [Plectosphaerella cucumerina]
MVKILPPYKPNIPEPPPGMALHIAPAGHVRWIDDYEFFDQLGRDPMQQARLWLITDDEERATRMGQILDDYPKQKHRREMLFITARRGDEAVVRRIVATGIKVQPEIPPQPRTEEERKAKENLENQRADQDARESDSIPDRDDPEIVPVHAAAASGHLGCLRILLEDGAVDANTRDIVGRTPLIVAAGFPDILRYLIGRGAEPAARTDADTEVAKSTLGIYAGADALAYAAAIGRVESVRQLLEHDSVRVTPLAIKGAAAVGGAEGYEPLKLLLVHGGYPMEGRDGKTKGELLSEEQARVIDEVIPNAAMDGSLDSLRMLLEYRFPVDADGNLVMPLELPESLHKSFVYGAYEAAAADDRTRFDFLRGFNVREHDTMSLDGVPAGQTLNMQHLLEKAAEGGATNIARFLVDEMGADVNAHRLPIGVKPLYYAAAYDQPEMVKQLLEEHGADIHLGSGRYAAGPTALGAAVMLKSLESVEHLLRHGGPVDRVSEGVRVAMMEGEGSVKAVLKADWSCDDTEIRAAVVLETEEEAKEYLEECRGDWQRQNPLYVRMELGPGDEGLVDGLKMRRRVETLRETGLGARELRVGDEELEEGDARAVMGEFPTFTARETELEKDEDLLPKFIPWLK